MFFKIKRNTKLQKLQGAYATKVGKDVSSIRFVLDATRYRVLPKLKPTRFLYDGNRINEDDTPATLDMEDNGARVVTSFYSRTNDFCSVFFPPRHDRCDGRT